MISIDNLTFKYRHGATALKDISTDIDPGIHLLMGENGAGKTTLLNIIAGTLYPTSGRLNIDGYNPIERSTEFLESIFLLEENMHVPARTINEWAAIHGCFYPRFNAGLLRDNLTEMDLTGNEPLADLSLGLAKKSRLAYALSLGVDILMLDEPTNGIDITARKAIRNMIARSTGDDTTVIIATHSVQDFETLFDGIIMLHRAKLVFNMSTWQIGERLAFDVNPMPAFKPLYQEIEDGLYRSILPNPDSIESKVNIPLLYRSLQSTSRMQILKSLQV